MARPAQDQWDHLTETELVVMQVLWNLNGGHVSEVQECLEELKSKNYAYTTVSTLLRVLEKKGYVFSEKQGRGHKYTPTISESIYQNKTLNRVVDQLFSGQPSQLLKSLLGTKNLSEQEKAELQDLIARS